MKCFCLEHAAENFINVLKHDVTQTIQANLTTLSCSYKCTVTLENTFKASCNLF